ncbi:MAG: TRAP transporter large permease [Alphaproteobacteria bacterium]|nr:TRAP transporter large permease [Alphaproteobacteria bacterium]
MIVWSVLFGTLAATVGGGAALGGALGLTGFIILYFFNRGTTEMAVMAVYNLYSSFTLSSFVVFILLGELMMQSGLSRRAFGAVAPAFHRIPGGLLHTNVVVCAIFGAVSGSSASVAATVGTAAFPELARRGYRTDAIVGSLAGAGTLGILIPPSLTLVLYGAWQEVSIGQLFLAGILPGIMMMLLFMALVLVQCLYDRTITPAVDGPAPPLPEILRSALGLWPLVLLVGAVLGTIYLGFATPTEAAGLGVLTAVILGVTVGDLTWRGCVIALWNTIVNFGALKLVLIGAVILGQAISILGLPRHITELALAYNLGKYELLLFVVLMYFVLGCIFDGLSLMLLTLPFVFPVFTKLGFDPIWLGIFMTMMIEIGAITPPVGVNLFVLSAVTGQRESLGAIARATVPYWIVLLIGVAIITLVPDIVLLIPRSMR